MFLQPFRKGMWPQLVSLLFSILTDAKRGKFYCKITQEEEEGSNESKQKDPNYTIINSK
jgi:hypothetical protein